MPTEPTEVAEQAARDVAPTPEEAPLMDAVAAYAKAQADVQFYRDEVYKAIRAQHASGSMSIRDIAGVTGFSYGRVGQILRGE